MANIIKAGVLRRNSNWLGSGLTLNAQTFNVADIENARNCYVKDTYNFDISTPQLAGGQILNDSSLIVGAEEAIEFFYRDGADARFTRYVISCNQDDYITALNDSDNITTLDPTSNYTLVG
jgi:hypothetical protein